MDPWKNDKLGYQAIGATFTNLIKTIDSAKVISIEAGFGRGKTFFREAWSKQLRKEGEVVIEIDVQQSDHSGDPVVTLLGALVDAMLREDVGKSKKTIESVKKIGAICAKSAVKFALRSGADDVIGAFSDKAIDKLDDFDALKSIINEIGEGMSKAAGQFIAAQMAAEKVRTIELPEQLKVLRTALLGNSQSDRVIIIIDELDRCHPDYAIAVLEAMKLVFNNPGFVFCLMVNADYLESLAQHRFGGATNDEKYLDKFVDIRLKLDPKEDNLKKAVFDLASELPLYVPYGEDKNFSIEHAAKLASNLAVHCGLSMRNTKRILLKVEIALRCYSDRPLDVSLLVLMAFQEKYSDNMQHFLPRSFLTPEEGQKQMIWYKNQSEDRASERDVDFNLNKIINENGTELLNLPHERYGFTDDQDYKPWVKAFKYLAPHYLPSHQDVLNAVAEVIAP